MVSLMNGVAEDEVFPSFDKFARGRGAVAQEHLDAIFLVSITLFACQVNMRSERKQPRPACVTLPDTQETHEPEASSRPTLTVILLALAILGVTMSEMPLQLRVRTKIDASENGRAWI